jgi:hypothetical protein
MIKYLLPKGQRRKKGVIRWLDPQGRFHQAGIYFGITTFDGYWWHNDLKRWVPGDVPGDKSSHFGMKRSERCRSVRAFRRRLRQWQKYLPKGIEFILCSRFDELCVKGKT